MDSPPAELQDRYDDAMYDFTMEQYDSAIAKLEAILADDPTFFDAQLSLGMAWCRKGDFARAIAEGHKAEKLRPQEQLVHTNLSLFYMRAGDKKTAEHHGLQARISSWRGNMTAPGTSPSADDDLKMAAPPQPPATAPIKVPDQPWKKKNAAPSSPAAPVPPPSKPPASPSTSPS